MSDQDERVAIVGMGGVFPGAPDLERFWANVAASVDATSDVPPGRWALDPADAYDPTPGTPDCVYSTRGGFLEEITLDLEGLALDPALVRGLDPMFRLALHAARDAWRDAGCEDLDRSRIGVVIGNLVLPTESASALARETLGRTLEERVLGDRAGSEPGAATEPLNRFAAGLPAGIVGRALGMGGGSYTLDAACASSLYALKLAADELLSGRADAMLAGGLSRPDPLHTQMGFSQLRALSLSGRARPFDARADGLVVGEGAGIFVLERLVDAVRHGRRIHGVIAGVGLSNDVDGGLLAPSSEGQLRALRAAYSQAGWKPTDVDLIECHATGTPVGDAVELQSLKTLWGDSTDASGRCVLGSHKGTFGHCLTASGAAGLIKVLLALAQKTLPPTANFASISLESDGLGPFRIPTGPEPWRVRADGAPRRAAVSGFGFGGINAHLLIEEWAPERAEALARTSGTPSHDDTSVAIVGMSAHFGPFHGLRSFQEYVLGGEARPSRSQRDWGVGQSSWVAREAPGDDPDGCHIEAVALPTDRFRIPPKELDEMLPQQSLALLAASDAVRDAGWDERPRLRAGVIFGIALDANTTNFHVRWGVRGQVETWEETLGLDLSERERADWTRALRDAAGPPLTANRTMGALGGLIASRIAREFRLGGPSFTVSSEETSGLRALDVAVGFLRRGELDEAVVGAVDLTGDPRWTVAARRAGISPTVRGDGAAAVVLKRLDDARRDGDRVYGVIRGVGFAGGSATDAAAPDGDVIRRAIEAVPVATAFGSAALGYVDVNGPERMNPETVAPTLAGVSLALGSARFDVGHVGAATGFASFVKAVICLYQQIMPCARGPLAGPNAPRFWLRDRVDGPRQAAVAVASVDGNVAHVVLEEHEGPESPLVALERAQPLGTARQAIFAVEADDENGLLEQLGRLDALIVASPNASIEAIARRWWAEHPNDPSLRLGIALVASEMVELREKTAAARRRLDHGVEGDGLDGVYYRPEPLGSSAEVALVFPGIGNGFAGMGRELSALRPEVFRAMDHETARLRSQLAPGSRWDFPKHSTPKFTDLRAPIMAQVVFGTAVADLLRMLGVRPSAVIGYSLGESTALFATRTWTDRDAMHARLDSSPLFATDLTGPCDAARRAWKLSPDEPVDWLSAVIPLPPDVIRAALADIPRAYLLAVNIPDRCVVGGARRDVERLVKTLGTPCYPIDVVSTVHCPVVHEVEEAYRALHRLETTPPPGVRFYSAALGRSYIPDRESAAEAIAAQALVTVDFPGIIRRAYDDGVRIFLEAGPGASCTRMIAASLSDRPHLAASASEDDGVAAGVLHVLASLIAERVPVDFSFLHGRETRVDGREIESRAQAHRSVTVAVGGLPFDVPKPPAPGLGRSAQREKPESRSPDSNGIGTVDDWNGSGAPSFPNLGPPYDLARQVIATETSRGEAHAAFLRVSGAIAQTLESHMSFQMALIEAMMAAPTSDDASMSKTLARGRSDAPLLDRARCLEFAVGSIAQVLGDDFATIDAHPTRVRLPDEPLMLVDRVLAIEGEARSLSSGRVVTEHDVRAGSWYLDQDRIPTCIAVEAGQADLLLSGYLGIDFETRGRAVYRLLDAVVTFHGGLPGPGAIIHYDIRISRFFRQGDTYLFRFEFEATVAGAPLLSMRDGCAGFFTAAELASGKGIVHTALDVRPTPGKRRDDCAPFAPMAVESYDDAQIAALRRGDYARAFGPAFEGLAISNPLRLPGGRMTLLHRVPRLEPEGGRYGLGRIRGELDIDRDDWFLTCHFVDDQVMPGTLMYECCLHTLRVFLMRMGWVGQSEGVAYEPVAGVASRLRCRGQVIASTRKAVFELDVKELGYGPEPYAIADALMYADGKPVVEVLDMSIRMTGLTREKLDRLWERGAPARAKPVFTRDQVLAFAQGKPSEAFGAAYQPFDGERVIARLPAPPYSFLDRVTVVSGEPWKMVAGVAAVAEYDVPPDAWYFAANRQPRMPFAVLLEIPLQVCGWLAAYLGSALTSDEDLAFRNLGGSGTVLLDVSPAAGTLTSRVKLTKVAHSGGMIIQHFDVETFAGDAPVYRGDTYFGFFRRAALADQVGIREAATYTPSEDETARARRFAYPSAAPFPVDQLRMIAQVECFISDGGPHGFGFIAGTKIVDPAAWFFAAHFVQDPVVPGSLGLESFLQLLRVVAVERWGVEAAAVGFETPAVGATHRWTYRGQVVPRDRLVTTQAVVTNVDDQRRRLSADGFLSVDGRVIYQMNDFTLEMI